MIFSNILPGILLAQLLFPVLGGPATFLSEDPTPDLPNGNVTGVDITADDRNSQSKPTIEIKIKGKKNKFKFGSKLKVMFKYSSEGMQPKLNHWVGIYRKESIKKHQAYLYTCGRKNNNHCKHAPKSGTLTYSVHDPASGTGQLWPLNPGEYTICLFDGGYNVISNCLSYEIKTIKNKVIKKVEGITSRKRKFQVEDSIILNFDVRPVSIPGTWIGLYLEGYDDKEGLPDTNRWIYPACNNQHGDQMSNLCAKSPEKGEIVINRNSMRVFPLKAGKYYACTVFNSNAMANGKFELYKCDSKPIIITEKK